MSEVDRKKPFSSLEKDLFLNIIQKYDAILTSNQTNATTALKKKHTWERIKDEFNEASIVSQKASTKQLTELWYNMKAKARESKTKENISHLTGGGPSVVDMDAIDSKVMDIDRNILTNVAVDIDSDIDGSVLILGDDNNGARSKTQEITAEIHTHTAPPEKIHTHTAPPEKKEEKKSVEYKTPIKKSHELIRTNKIDLLKCQILEEELEYKKKIHEEELQIKVLEREHKEKIYKLELEIKLKELNQ